MTHIFRPDLDDMVCDGILVLCSPNFTQISEMKGRLPIEGMLNPDN